MGGLNTSLFGVGLDVNSLVDQIEATHFAQKRKVVIFPAVATIANRAA